MNTRSNEQCPRSVWLTDFLVYSFVVYRKKNCKILKEKIGNIAKYLDFWVIPDEQFQN